VHYCSWTTKTLLIVESRGTTRGCTASAASHITCINFSFVRIFMLSGSFEKSPYRLMKKALSGSSGSLGDLRTASNSCSTGSTFRLRCLAIGITDDTDCCTTDDTDCCCFDVDALLSASDGVGSSALSVSVSSTVSVAVS